MKALAAQQFILQIISNTYSQFHSGTFRFGLKCFERFDFIVFLLYLLPPLLPLLNACSLLLVLDSVFFKVFLSKGLSGFLDLDFSSSSLSALDSASDSSD